jgi:hypothetical protein
MRMSRAHTPKHDDAELALVLESVARGHETRMIARGSSMAHAICDGDTIVLTPVTRAPTLGDVVAVTDGDGRFFVHRVIGLRADGAFLVGGDTNRSPDGWFRTPHLKAFVRARVVDGRELTVGKPTLPKAPSMTARIVRRARRALSSST